MNIIRVGLFAVMYNMFCFFVHVSYDSVVPLSWVGLGWVGLVGLFSQSMGWIRFGHIKWTQGQLWGADQFSSGVYSLSRQEL